jgi:hypothetical protein
MVEVKMLLTRLESSDFGTFGLLTLGGFRCFTLEPPDRGNAPEVSCIPAGGYEVGPWSSASYRQALHVLAVPGRVGILIHQGNWAGDRSLGLKSNSRGCILVGARRGEVMGQPGVLDSVITLARLCALVTEKTPLVVE